jgi:NitT/TauT family transport system substrate-binding protein
MKKIMSVILILSVIMCFGCKGNEDVAKMQTPQKVTVAQFGHLLIYYPIYLAKQKDFYKKNNLDVTFVSTGGDDKTLAAVSSGSALFGVADPIFVAIAQEKGLKAKVVGTLIDGAPMWIVAKEKIDMNSADALKNKKIMTYPSPSTSYTLLSEIITNLKPKTNGAKIIQGAFGTEFAMVEGKNADAFFTIEPIASTGVDKGYHIIYSAMDQFGPMSFSGISVLDESIAKHPETIKAFILSTQQAMDFLKTNFDEAVELAAKEFPETKKTILRDALKRMLDEKVMPTTLETKEASWNKAVEIRKKVGDLKTTPVFSDVVANQFVKVK